MSDIKLFQITNNKVVELEGKSISVEKSLQPLIGHQGTGDLEIFVRLIEDLEKAKPFILKSNEIS